MMQYHSLLFSALTSTFGLIVETNDPETLREHLYKARKADPRFLSLSFLTSPQKPETDVWIIKRQEIIYAETEEPRTDEAHS